jgi:hypothetical protein
MHVIIFTTISKAGMKYLSTFFWKISCKHKQTIWVTISKTTLKSFTPAFAACFLQLYTHTHNYILLYDTFQAAASLLGLKKLEAGGGME